MQNSLQWVRCSCSRTSVKDTKRMKRIQATASPLILANTQVLHSATALQLECIESIKPFFAENVLPLLAEHIDKEWQPADLLPNPKDSDMFHDQLKVLRQHAAELPDELLVCLVGDMVTEEALPTYMAMLNTLDGVRDDTGCDISPYAQWTRKWVAEENRHGDVLNKYLWLTGKVDMLKVEGTIQNLIGSGMDPQTENNAYLCFIYTSFQERATKLSHGNTARLVNECAGDERLATMCGLIAKDEGRHEIAYTRIVTELFKRDPNNAMLSFADMMKKKVSMPAHLMDDSGEHQVLNSAQSNLFNDFSEVAESIGVYSMRDYIGIMEHLIGRWGVAELNGLTTEAHQAQEYVLQLPEKFKRLADRRDMSKLRNKGQKSIRFSWLKGREIVI